MTNRVSPLSFLSRRRFIGSISVFLVEARTMLGLGVIKPKHSPVREMVLENLALHRAAYQSSSIDDDHTAHLVTDGSSLTYWESKPGVEAWIDVDLGERTSFNEMTLAWGPSYARSFRLQHSSEALHPQQWTDFFSTTEGIGGLQTIPAPDIQARHVRLIFPGTASSQTGRGCVLQEIRIPGNSRPRAERTAQPAPAPDGTLILNGGNWKLQSALFVRDSFDRIARATYDDSGWIPAVVPGTVLGSYLALGAIPDPWYGDQMSQISEEFFSRTDFWYRNTFNLPASSARERIWLNFDGINWKAQICLNGIVAGQVDGAFVRGRFDVTDLVRPGQRNCLAVLVHHVAHPDPGPQKVTHKRLGMRTTNGDDLGLDSPTFLASAGWNWLPIVRGRDIGIWQDVWLERSGDVTIVDPWVTTELRNATQANLTIRMEVSNHAATVQKGRISGTIGLIGAASLIGFAHDVELAANERRTIILDSSKIPELSMMHPQLWWPNGYGDQPLYRLDLSFHMQTSVSDRKRVDFGIRDLQCKVLNNALTIFVNGTRILCRGGNWGMAEGMLNCDAAGLDLRVRMHREANLNMIRNWIGMEGHQAFYDSCDRHGILVWEDFWLANPVDGPEPLDREMFMANARDKVRRVRGHACLALYCGRNEGLPPADLDAAMRSTVDALDGTRHYIPHSAAGTVSGLGPYDVREPEWYFANRGKDMHSEQGIIAIPTVESMREMMPSASLWPINEMWAVHDYQEPRSRLYTERIAQRYGEPSGIEDYCRKAQLLNLESAKAMYECLQANQGSGMLLWMTQAAWPSLICQLYDHYFEMTGAYFGAKSGCEPVHVLWDSEADIIKAANNTTSNLSGLKVEARSYDLNGKQSWEQTATLDLPATTAHACFAFPRPSVASSVFFLDLRLLRGTEVLSENFYWGSARGGTCVDLLQLPPVHLRVSANQRTDEETRRIAVAVTNPTGNVALTIRLKVHRAQSGARVLPVHYSDNFFSLLPGASRNISLEFPERSLAGEMPKLIVEGWNHAEQEVTIR